SRPADVETFIGSTYAQIQNATLGGSNDDLQTQLQVMGMENTSALANFAMGPRGAVPRRPIDNTRNGTGSAGNYRDFQVLTRAAQGLSGRHEYRADAARLGGDHRAGKLGLIPAPSDLGPGTRSRRRRYAARHHRVLPVDSFVQSPVPRQRRPHAGRACGGGLD